MLKKRIFACLFLLLLLPARLNAAEPHFTGYTGPGEAFEGYVYRGRFTVVDPDGDPLIFSTNPGSPSLVITDPATGRFRWTPTKAQARAVTGPGGHFVIGISAFDGTHTKVFRKRVKLWRRIESAHFEVFWKNSVSHQAYAEAVRDALETGTTNAWTVETGSGQLNYHKPKCLGGSKMPVFIDQIADMGVTRSSHAPHYVDEANEGAPCRPCIIQIDVGLNPLHLKATCAHEFFHSIQDYYNWNALWWDEATAVWMEDKVFDSVNDYVSYFNNVNSIFNRPWRFIRSTYDYGGCLFPIFIDEYSENAEIIKKSWKKLKGNPSNDFVPVLTDPDVLGLENLGKYWREFAIRNVIVKGLSGHEYKEGVLFGKKAIMSKTFQGNRNHHFITKQAPLRYPPPRNKGMTIDHDQFAKVSARIPGLSSYYIGYEIPKQLKDNRDRKSRFFLYFKGDAAGAWACDVVKIKKDGSTYDPDILKVIDFEAGEKENTVDFEIGGDREESIHKFIVIVSNADTANTPRRFHLAGAAVPGLQNAYGNLVPAGKKMDPVKGTSRTVKNILSDDDGNDKGPDEDNIYKNGDTVKLEVDLSDIVHIGAFGNHQIPLEKRTLTADFSAIDSAYREGSEIVKEKDGHKHRYTFGYAISEENTLHRNRMEKDIPVAIKVTSLSRMDGEKDREEDTTFRLTVDNQPPGVRGVTLTQQQNGEEVIILDSEEDIKHPARIADETEHKLKLVLQFMEAMQTHEKDGTEVSPVVWIQGREERKLTFRKTGGWEKTDKKNDTWVGELSYLRNDIEPAPRCRIFIEAKDKAGNSLDTDLYQDGIQPEDRYAFFWMGPEINRVLISQGAESIYNSEAQIYREGKAGTFRVQVIFNESMENVVLSFGPNRPYEKTNVTMVSEWGDKKVWDGEFIISEEDFPVWQGAHRIKISGTGEFGHLDANYRKEGIQPDTSHIFLIGASKAWAASLTINENRLVEYSRKPDVGEARMQFSTDYVVKLAEDWGPAVLRPVGFNNSTRKERLEERNKKIRIFIEALRNNPKEIEKYRNHIKKNEGRHSYIKQAERTIERFEAEMDLAKKALVVMAGTRFYAPIDIEVDCRGHFQGNDTDYSIGHRWDSSGIKTTSVKISKRTETFLDLTGCAYHVDLFPERDFLLVSTTISKKQWDALEETALQVGKMGGGKVFLAIPLSGRDLFWPDYWNIHALPENPQRSPFLTLVMDTQGAAPMQSKPDGGEGCFWIGQEKYSSQTHKPDPPKNLKILFPGSFHNHSPVFSGYPLKLYPLFDYTPFHVQEVLTSPELPRFRKYPYDRQTSNRGSGDPYQPKASDHFYQFIPGRDGRTSFKKSYSVKGTSFEQNWGWGKVRREGIIHIDVRLHPLPEGDL